MSRPGALPALPRRSPRRCPSALPALPRHLSSAAPVRNFIPDPQILSVICEVARHTTQVPSLRGAPGRPTFRSARKKSARLCGEMRVHFCLSKLCCLTKRNGRAHKNPPNGFLRRNLVAAFSPDALPKHSRMSPSRPALEAFTPKAKICAEIVA